MGKFDDNIFLWHENDPRYLRAKIWTINKPRKQDVAHLPTQFMVNEEFGRLHHLQSNESTLMLYKLIVYSCMTWQCPKTSEMKCIDFVRTIFVSEFVDVGGHASARITKFGPHHSKRFLAIPASASKRGLNPLPGVWEGGVWTSPGFFQRHKQTAARSAFVLATAYPWSIPKLSSKL